MVGLSTTLLNLQAGRLIDRHTECYLKNKEFARSDSTRPYYSYRKGIDMISRCHRVCGLSRRSVFTLLGAFSLAVALVAATPQAHAQEIFVTSYDSSLVQHFNIAGASLGVFASSGLSLPYKPVFSPITGDLYVASYLTNSVVRYNATTGAVVQTITDGMRNPSGLTFDSSGNLLVLNNSRGDITRYDGTTGAFLGTFTTGLFNSYNITLGPDGDIYAVEGGNARIMRISGISGGLLGPFATTNMSQPVEATFGPDGNMYVSDQGNESIMRYNGISGAFIDTFSSRGLLLDPQGIVFAPDGRLLVANYNGDNIVAIDSAGNQSVFATGINGPNGITIRGVAAAAPEPATFALLALGTGGLIFGGWGFDGIVARRKGIFAGRNSGS